MNQVYHDVTQLIGNTPIVSLRRVQAELELEANLYGKLEYLNPSGSVKDRTAYAMIQDAKERGTLQEGGTIIEPTSGNTGIGIASIGAANGYRTILTLPETMSVERRNLLKAYGAELVLTDGKLGMKGAIARAKELQEEIEGSILLGQFDNAANAKVHYETTGPELYEAMGDTIDYVVAGIGTGGTITGISKYLKEKNPKIQIIGVEPSDSPVLTQGTPGPHGIQGIGAGFVPEVLDTTAYDEVITVSKEDAYDMGRLIATKEGILVGISSGAATYAGVELARRPENQGKKIVIILPDSGDRYLSTPMFSEM